MVIFHSPSFETRRRRSRRRPQGYHGVSFLTLYGDLLHQSHTASVSCSISWLFICILMHLFACRGQRLLLPHARLPNLRDNVGQIIQKCSSIHVFSEFSRLRLNVFLSHSFYLKGCVLRELRKRPIAAGLYYKLSFCFAP